MRRGKKAVVDIDNTLWPFHTVFYEQLKMINRDMPPFNHWTDWEFWKRYCSRDDFYGAINVIHFDQANESHLPYPEAREFLATLKDHEYHIIIASHRLPESRKQTERWLERHELQYDELHLSFNKTALFDMNTHVVVDDAPQVLKRALENGAISTGLLFPWNTAYADDGFRLFDNLDEVLSYILRR
jgi:hypothetical protein